MTTDIDALMRSQHGVATRRQLLQLMSADQIRTRLERQDFLPVHRGVYRAKGSPLTGYTRIMAAVLAAHGKAKASHTSALWLHNLPSFGVNLPHVTVSSGSLARPNILMHRSIVTLEQTTMVQRIPVTNIARTLVDVSGMLTPGQLSRVITEATVKKVFRPEDAVAVLTAIGSRGRDGTAGLQNILAQHLPLPITESTPTKRLLLSLREAKLILPELEHRVVVGGKEYFLDAAWPALRLAVEMDDFGSHGKSRKRFDADRRRNNILAAEGWTVIHLTTAMSNQEFVQILRHFLTN